MLHKNKERRPSCSLKASRRSRYETSFQIRKIKKDKMMMARRRMMRRVAPAGNKSAANTMPIGTQIETIVATYSQCAKDATYVSTDQVYGATKQLRRLLADSSNASMVAALVLQANLLPFLVAFLEYDTLNELQIEAAWALACLSSTNRTKDVAESGAVPHLVRLLATSEDPEVREKAIWCIGNIAEESIEYRDRLLSMQDLINGMIRNLNSPTLVPLVKQCGRTVLNLCQGNPVPPFQVVQGFVRPLVSLLRSYDASELCADDTMAYFRLCTAWTLCNMSTGGEDCIQALIDSDTIPLLVSFLDLFPDNRELIYPTVRTLGNLATGNDQQLQAVIEGGFLKYAYMLLNHLSKEICKETCWILSNVAMGTDEQIGALFKAKRQGKLMERVVKLATNSDYQVRKEAVWTLSNVVISGKDYDVQCLVQVDGIRGLCAGLELTRESKLLLTTLEALEKLLEIDEAYGRNYGLIMEEYGGIERLEDLQVHPNDEVYEKSYNLIQRFFSLEDETDENVVPQQEDGAFRFGLSQKTSPSFSPWPSTTQGDRLLNANTHEAHHP